MHCGSQFVFTLVCRYYTSVMLMIISLFSFIVFYRSMIDFLRKNEMVEVFMIFGRQSP